MLYLSAVCDLLQAVFCCKNGVAPALIKTHHIHIPVRIMLSPKVGGLNMARKTPFVFLFLCALISLPWNALARGGGGCIEEGARIEMVDGAQAVETLQPGNHVACAASGLVLRRLAGTTG